MDRCSEALLQPGVHEQALSERGAARHQRVAGRARAVVTDLHAGIQFTPLVGMMESSPRRAARKGRRRRLISVPKRRAEAVAERRAEGAPCPVMGLEPDLLVWSAPSAHRP